MNEIDTKRVEESVKIQSPCIVPKEWNILQRMNWVRAQISYVQKDSQVQGQYKAVRHDAVTAHVRPFLIQAGIVTTQTLKSSKVADTGSTTKNNVPIIRYEALYEISFHNAEDIGGKAVSVDVESHALDQGDKAPGKAMSYAKKYAYLKEFDIETGEDEESRIEQKATQDIEAEQAAFRAEQLNAAISEHMDSIQAIKQGIKEAEPIVDKKAKQAEFNNEPALTVALEAWAELTNEEKKALWVAPSKGGPFSTDERLIMRCDRWAALHREMIGADQN
jgi:hypothetical protein